MKDMEMPRVHGMNSMHFKRLGEGYKGTLSRHERTIVIVLHFTKEEIAKNAEEYITGDRERQGNVE